MRKSAPFRIAGQLRCKAADNGFKQVQIAYLALISYLDKQVQPSYTLSMQISPLGLPRAVLGNACHFDLRLITLISALINGNVQTITACKELKHAKILYVCPWYTTYTATYLSILLLFLIKTLPINLHSCDLMSPVEITTVRCCTVNLGS